MRTGVLVGFLLALAAAYILLVAWKGSGPRVLAYLTGRGSITTG